MFSKTVFFKCNVCICRFGHKPFIRRYQKQYTRKPKNDPSIKRPHLTNCKGTVDVHPREMQIRNWVLQVSSESFCRHGAVQIDTPTLELQDVLTNKYGEEAKMIYNLPEIDNELSSLRYDLTVPFARYLATNNIEALKRYQIGKVYRKDNPAVSVGRYREFYQCDFDIAGEYDPMIPDVECLQIISEILSELEFKNYVIKVNHRRILDGLLEICGITHDKFNTVCHSIDKLGKVTWNHVRTDLIEQKKLNTNSVDKLGEYVQLNGDLTLVDRLLQDDRLSTSPLFCSGLENIRLLLNYCQNYGVDDRISFDMSLARGLDYYTGIVFEAVLIDPKDVDMLSQVGSVAGGGRYDDIVGLFRSDRRKIPCVGLSIGVERISSLLKALPTQTRTVETEVFVATPQKGFEEERMKLCRTLWDANIKAEMAYKKNPKLLNQLQHCEEMKIPLVIIIGECELQRGTVKIRDVETRTEEEIPRTELVQEIKQRIRYFSNF